MVSAVLQARFRFKKKAAELAQHDPVGGQDVISMAMYEPSEEGGIPRKGRVITAITH